MPLLLDASFVHSLQSFLNSEVCTAKSLRDEIIKRALLPQFRTTLRLIYFGDLILSIVYL